jgi:hypothetical protein
MPYPIPCFDHAVLLKATASGLPARVRLLPATKQGSTKVVIRSIPISDAGVQCETKTFVVDEEKSGSSALQKRRSVNCWTSSSGISGYHAEFNEGHGTVGAWQGRGMAWVN